MKIRKLEMQGFKSFADRVTLHFGPGISGVVGPNGCGKSNVVDAVRWCIGEQSARSLRGDAMADVIFAGTAARQGVSFAEVTLTFVADPEPFPGIWQRYAELEITRRLYRDGGSDYRINQERVRLRDIADLFLDTGVGNRLYSFIEQGRIGQIVHARPQERRTLVEEAAGISRYKLRREESLASLAQTREALERVADLHDDLGRRLKAAEKAVSKALRAQSVEARLRQEELALALGRFGGLAADRKVLGERARAALLAFEEASRALQRNDEELEARRRVHEAAEAEAGRIRDRLTEIEAERRVEESARQYQGRERDGAEARIEVLARDQRAAAAERAESAEVATTEGAAAVAAETELAAKRREADERGRALQAAHAAVAAARAGVERERGAASAALAECMALRGRGSALTARRQDLDARATRQQAASTAAAPTLGDEEGARVGAALAEAEAALRAATAQVEALRSGVAAVGRAREEAATAVRAREAELTAALREREGLRARAESLGDLERRQVELPSGVRAATEVPGAMGVLGRALRVPAAVEELVARAFDGAMDAVLVPDAETAIAAAAGAGPSRVRILALTGSSSEQLLGIAAELPATDGARAAVARLLPDLEVVPDVRAAYAAWSPGRTLVTRDGAVLRRDGLLVLGSDSGTALASVRRRREIEELEARIAAVPVGEREAAVEAARLTLKDAEAAIARDNAAIEAARSVQRQREVQVGEARHRLREVEAERLRAARAAEGLAREAEAILAAEAAWERDRASVAELLSAAEARQAAVEARLRECQVALEATEPALERAQQAHQDLRLACQEVQSRAQSHAQSAAGARARCERAESRGHQIAAERNDLDTRLVQLALDEAATSTALQRLGEAAGVLAGELESARGRALAEKERVRLGEAAVRAARDRRDTARDQHVEADGALKAVRAEIEALLAGTEERHGAALPALLDRVERDGALLVAGWEPLPGEAELGAEAVPTARLDARALDLDDAAIAEKSTLVDSLREQRFRIGEVNPEAVPEYHAEKARFDDIDRQRADLVSAMEVIESALAKVNQACRERFRDTFDRVNEHFSEIYPRLVGGGSARLDLVDDEDLLTCGVEMLVQPPGKKVQNLGLLSGGEKAMAAIGLIFALFRVKPSPFCLLDEVDAPLDEGNGARFNDMLKTMANGSQFIVITHNKKTMEAADVLYGITMPEPGMSRLVTVRLEGS